MYHSSMLSLYKAKFRYSLNALVLPVVHAWQIPSIAFRNVETFYIHIWIFIWWTFHFRFENFAVTSSGCIAALNRNLLYFLSVSYTSCLFHRASYDGITPCLCWYISGCRGYSFPCILFLSGNFEIFTATSVNNWVASIIRHFFHNCKVFI